MNAIPLAERLSLRIEQLERDNETLTRQLDDANAAIAMLHRVTPEQSLAILTAVAESRIEKLMHGAIERDADSDGMASTMRAWAHGVYLAWHDLTSGRRSAADDIRMKNLTIPATYERTHHGKENSRIAA